MISAQSGHVVIEIAPSRIEVAVVRGRRVAASAWRRIASTDFESRWPGSLGAAGPALAELVAELGCAGSSAVTIFHAPGAAFALCSCPTSFAAAEAEGAAALAIAAVADFPIDGEPCDVRAILVDSPSSAEKGVRQAHHLGAAAKSEHIDAIEAWVESAGLRFAGASPSGAVTLRAALHGAWRLGRRAGDRSAVLWIGEHGSALASVTEGTVRFVRPVGMGLESLVEALRQPMRGRDECGAELTLDHAAARTLLGAAGVPAPDAPLPGHEGFTGASMLPVIQPGLQRITIETKQSLRFGLNEGERSSVRLTIAGPGACVPGLGEWIARQCGLRLAEETRPGAGLESSAESGAIAAFVDQTDDVPVLMPARLVRRRVMRRMRAALVTGVAIAGALTGYEWYSAQSQLLHERSRLQALEQRAAADQALARTREAAVAARLALAAAEQRARAGMGESGDAAGVLAAVAKAAPESVRLNTVDIAHENGECVCRVSGFVQLSESEDPAGVIKKFIDDLGAIPIVSGTRLGATQRVLVEGAQSQSFDVSMRIVQLPVAGADGVASAEEARP